MNHKSNKSCGIIIKVVDKYLICRSTNCLDNFGREIWGFPKGISNKDETKIQTAIRETYEETGLTFNEDMLTFLCCYKHKRKKIYFWEAFLDELNLDDLECSSIVEGKNYPENDDFKLVDKEELKFYIHNHMKIVIDLL